MPRHFEHCSPDIINVISFKWLNGINNYNDFFHPNVCHVCKRPLIYNSISCNLCYMISYCSDFHKSKHFFEHRRFCVIIRQYLKQESRSLPVSTSEWIYKRYELLYQVSQRVGYNLPLHETQMIIFAKSCYDCHRQIGLQSCKICLSENYCDEHEEGFEEHHASKCEMLKRSLFLKISNLSQTKFLEFIRFPNPEKSFNDMEDFIRNFVHCSTYSFWGFKDYVHSDYVSGPLTLYNVMKEVHLLDILCTTQRKDNIWFIGCVIHIISTNPLQRKYMKAWEILLHLLLRIKSLTIVLIGSGLQEENISVSLCSRCSKRTLTIECYPKTYAEYVTKSYFQQPNVIIMFQARFHPVLEKSWFSKNVLTSWHMKCPYILTAGSQNIAEENIRSIEKILEKNVKPIYSAPNIFKSYIPCRILDIDCVAYRNAYVTVYKDLENEKEPSQMYRLDTLSTVWSNEWLDNVDKYNDFFHPNICHICKRNTDNLTPCDDCYMISYCGEAHKSKHFLEHKLCCTFIRDYLQKQNTEWRTIAVSTPDWINNRYDFLYNALKHFSHTLLLHEMQMIIFAKSCYDCHRQINLKSCDQCYSENYCDEHQRGFENHHTASKCKMLMLCLGLKTLNLNLKEFLTFDSFPAPEKPFADMYNFIKNYVWPSAHRDVTNANWTSFEYAHSDYVSGPLTLYSVMKKTDLLDILNYKGKINNSQCVIHIIANSVERRYARSWEILLHLLQNIKHLIIIMTGEDLQRERTDVSLCNICTGRKQLTIECYPVYHGYHLELYDNQKTQLPNAIIIFQAHFHMGPTKFSWICDALGSRHAFRRISKCLFIVTAGSKNIAELNIENILYHFNCKRPIYNAPNIFKSYIPYRLLHIDSVGYRNAHVTIWKDLKSMKRPNEPQPSTSKDI